MSDENCPWWSRWYHQRLRNIDRNVMIPALRRIADAKGRPESFAAMLLMFKAQPGQEHWHCACSEHDIGNVLEQWLAGVE